MLIGELSRRAGVSTRLLRYYEGRGLLAAGRDVNGYRVYDEDAVLVVRRIRALLAAGLTTQAIRSVLPCSRGEDLEFDLCDEVKDVLREELEAVDNRLAALRDSRNALVGYLKQPASSAVLSHRTVPGRAGSEDLEDTEGPPRSKAASR